MDTEQKPEVARFYRMLLEYVDNQGQGEVDTETVYGAMQGLIAIKIPDEELDMILDDMTEAIAMIAMIEHMPPNPVDLNSPSALTRRLEERAIYYAS